MEKKNTMLLTTIAVATLLITVVGATFAYFGVTLQNDSETVKISGSATNVGTITLTTPEKAMHLNLTGTEMAYDNRGEIYYASADENVSYYTMGTVTENLEYLINVLKISESNGDSSLSYTCDIDMNLSKTASDTMLDKLIADDSDHTFFFGTLEDLEAEDVTGALKVQDINFVNGSYDFSRTITLSAGDSIDFYSMFTIYNKNSEQDFANTILDLELKVNGINCKINK